MNIKQRFINYGYLCGIQGRNTYSNLCCIHNGPIYIRNHVTYIFERIFYLFQPRNIISVSPFERDKRSMFHVALQRYIFDLCKNGEFETVDFDCWFCEIDSLTEKWLLMSHGAGAKTH